MSSLRRRRRDIKKSQERIICRLREPHRSWSSLVDGDLCALIWRIFVTLTKKLTYFGNFNAIGLIWIFVNCQILKKQSNHLVTLMEMKARIGPSGKLLYLLNCKMTKTVHERQIPNCFTIRLGVAGVSSKTDWSLWTVFWHLRCFRMGPYQDPFD